jgi:N-acetylglucosamine malate deacetylase 1
MSSDSANSLSVLVIAPHHDDEVIGCGGTMAHLAKRGIGVDVVYMTAGYSGCPDIQNHDKATSLREKEAHQAAKILGVRNLFFLRYPDRGLVYSIEVVQNLIRLIRKNKYKAVYFPHALEQDFEHKTTHHIASEATWLANSQYFPELGEPAHIERVINYEVWTPMLEINFTEDISSFLEKKSRALEAFSSQFSKEKTKGLIGLNLYRAALSSTSASAVEAFKYHVRK